MLFDCIPVLPQGKAAFGLIWFVYLHYNCPSHFSSFSEKSQRTLGRFTLLLSNIRGDDHFCHPPHVAMGIGLSLPLTVPFGTHEV
jgi:hypothetical protein